MPKRISSATCSLVVLFVTLIAFAHSSHSHGSKTHRHGTQHSGGLLERDFVGSKTCLQPAIYGHNGYWLEEQNHAGAARGYAPFIQDHDTYPIFRNVKTYKAAGDGKTDDTQSLQNAINDDGRGGNRYQNEVTTRPAEVYLPGGTYLLTKQLDLRLNTILIGDPNNMPILKASPAFKGNTLINGYDFAAHASGGTTNFFVAIKNVIMDTTSVSRDSSIVALQWGVAQACQLSNLKIVMPTDSGGHLGIAMDQGSATAVTDISITGGSVGIRSSNQQANFKNIYFTKCTTAFAFHGGFTAVIQGASFDTCGLGVDGENGGSPSSIILLDSTSINSGPVVKFHDSSNDGGDRNNQIVIENLSHQGTNPIAVDTNGKTKLASSSNIETWSWGNVHPGNYQSGTSHRNSRSPSLLSNGKYFTAAQPTYREYGSDAMVNVKAVSGFVVHGDGVTDDSVSLNAILAANAANCKISYFPYGVYIVRSTLFVPKGTRIVGQVWSVISGIGNHFNDAQNPKAIVQVGNPGDVGVAQIQDMRFTVADIAPGAIILQVNMAGSAPGDVGIWNSHVTVGGAADTKVNTVCGNGNTANCKAAFAMVHLTTSSSCYIENMWGWTADHSLERGGPQNIATGRGILVESTKATWLVGTSFEHNTLYNYNLHNAQSVFAGMQQTETAYWQGQGSQQDAPGPWTADARYGDPDFSWCGGGDQSCRMGLAQNIDGGSNLFLYGAAFWTFFHGETQTRYNEHSTTCGANCIKHQARVTNHPKNLYWYGINSRAAEVMILDGVGNPRQYNNPGGWGCGNGCPGGVLAAYMPFSG